VRKALERLSTYSSDFDVSLERLHPFDIGDLPRAIAEPVVEFQQHLAEAIGAVRLQTEAPAVVIGGDNSITVGAFRGSGADGLITFDAHHDVREWDDRGPMNGSPVRQLIEGGLPGGRIMQIGLHGFSNAQPYARYVSEAGVATVNAHAVRSRGVDAVVEEALLKLEAAGATKVWVDVDLDCLEKALAPGAPAAQPGGLTPADLERGAFRLGASPLVTGLDITELDPEIDIADVTARTAASVLLAFAAGVAIRA
jgi:formiminoglutamase